MPRRKLRRSDIDSTRAFPQVQPQQAQQKTTSPLLSAFTSAASSSLPFNLLGNSPPPSISPQLFGTSPNLQYAAAGEYSNSASSPNGQTISIPNSFPRSFFSQVAQGGGASGAPHAISPPTGPGGVPSRGLQHHVSYPSFPEHKGTSVYATSPTPSHLSGRGGGGARPPTHSGHLRPGDSGWAFSFDVLDDLEGNIGSESAQRASGNGVAGTDVVCLGWEGGVDVWKVGRGVVELVARMSGLSGTVVGAKLLPTPRRDDPNAHLRPLICLVIHSPLLPKQTDDGDEPEQSPTPSENSRPASAASNRSSEQSSPQQQAEEYQTSVEIYSLSRRTHVATLYKSPLMPVGIGGVPAPLGIRLEVSNAGGAGNVVAVGIAGTGEVFVFGDSKPAGPRRRRSVVTDDRSWNCWGKVWTNVYVEGRGSSSSSFNAEFNPENLPSSKAGMPIFSLEGRWLAYCPPSPSAQALRMSTSFPSVGGVATGYPNLPSPAVPQPQANTYIDVPEDEPILNRVAREVTQEVIRGAKWMGEQGIRAMKNYWNGYNSAGNSSGSSPPGAGVKIGPNPAGTNGISALGMQVQEMREQERELAALGPGSGISAGKNGYGLQSGAANGGLATASSEPVVISIVDLGKSVAQGGHKNDPLTPQTTFQPLQGASFLAFAPGGMALLVVSNKGDVVHIWDLLKGMHQPPTLPTAQSKAGKSSPSAAEASAIAVNGRLANGHHAGRHVRQIARFTRMTVAHVVDVVWSGLKSDKLAIVTEKGTVHFYDMPGNAYQWPPPKRSVPQPKSPQGGVSGMVSSAGQAAASLLTNAQPLVVAARRRRRSSSGSVSGYGTSTGKDSTLGSSGNSVGQANATVHRVSLPYGPGTPGMGCVRFLGGKEYGFVAMIGGGTLRIYESKTSAVARRKSSSHDGGVITTGWLEYELPGLPDGTAAGIQEPGALDINEEPTSPLSLNEETTPKSEPTALPGYWGGKVPSQQTTPQKHKDLQKELVETPLSYAEIETNPPYPPIHSDRHVTLSVFKEESSIVASTTWYANEPPSNDVVWVFGRNIPFEKLDIGFARGEVEFVDGSDGLVEAMESGMGFDEHPPRQAYEQPRPERKKPSRVQTPPQISEVSEDAMIFEIPASVSSVKISSTSEASKKDTPVEGTKMKKKKKKKKECVENFGDEGFFEQGVEVLDESKKN
ncbi:hypothetical protein DRE_07515 [Drechslerella stenobrocha 248]|uniref:BCAS3 domain-containing protein n=1 Tax=Drechslerella stenobrocha 248 TaxID=1043628 RepID=W7HUF2_9PEZI|nr:hypothetical protein DRE_07515 [Drechslerella stenobrocha 248]